MQLQMRRSFHRSRHHDEEEEEKAGASKTIKFEPFVIFLKRLLEDLSRNWEQQCDFVLFCKAMLQMQILWQM